MRRRQIELLRAVLARLDSAASQVSGELARWSLAEMQAAGVATGLTAIAGELGLFDDASDEVAEYVVEQREQVRRRVQQFSDLLPSVMDALRAAAIPAVAVKGAALIQGVWASSGTRPMADIDIVVPQAQRAQASAALVGADLRPIESTTYEDTFLAWGDGGIGRTDGESAAHNGRVEVHPGWIEFLHGYTARGFAVERTQFDHEALTTHVLGHLSSTVVRAEVRAVNVVDVWWCSRRPIDWHRVELLMADTDPRLTAPAMWLIQQLMPDLVPAAAVDREMHRLPAAARRALGSIAPGEVLRDPSARTSFRWRQAFTMSARERIAVVDQMLWPAGVRSIGAARRRLLGRR